MNIDGKLYVSPYQFALNLLHLLNNPAIDTNLEQRWRRQKIEGVLQSTQGHRQ